MILPAPRALLFDLDGTLADTEPAWLAAKAAVAATHSIPWSEQDGIDSIGQPTPVYSAEFVRRGARATPERIAAEITAGVVDALRDAVRWRPGARELLAQAVALSIPTALVTMAYRPVAEAVAAATELPVFDVIVAGDEVRHSKPHPEPYVRAVAALGVDPSRAFALEDTLVGALSAEAAGLRTVVVPSHAPVASAPGRRVIASLADVRLTV